MVHPSHQGTATQMVSHVLLDLQEKLADLNAQAKKFVDEQHFDADSIQEKRDNIAKKYAE